MFDRLFFRIRAYFRGEQPASECLQCGLPAGREVMVATGNPIIHPHRCTWCGSTLYVPGPMFSCKACADRLPAEREAA